MTTAAELMAMDKQLRLRRHRFLSGETDAGLQIVIGGQVRAVHGQMVALRPVIFRFV